jgi:hypothetical protein
MMAAIRFAEAVSIDAAGAERGQIVFATALMCAARRANVTVSEALASDQALALLAAYRCLSLAVPGSFASGPVDVLYAINDEFRSLADTVQEDVFRLLSGTAQDVRAQRPS